MVGIASTLAIINNQQLAITPVVKQVFFYYNIFLFIIENTPMKMKRKKEILFLCTGNSCRSQMAEGLTRYLKSDLFIPYSAGVETHGMNEEAVAVMQEIGIDIRSHKSQHVDELSAIHFDYVVMVCDKAAQNCPRFNGNATIIVRPFDDPPALAAQETDPDKIRGYYRQVRDEIRRFVESLPGSLQ